MASECVVFPEPLAVAMRTCVVSTEENEVASIAEREARLAQGNSG